MIDDDTTDARALLTRVMGDEPPMTLTSRAVLRKAHRNTAIQRSAAMTGVAAVVATVVGVTVLARSGTAQEPTVAPASVVPMRTLSLEMMTSIPPCSTDTPGCPYSKDDRTRRLTQDVNAATGTVLSKGMAARPDPQAAGSGQQEPFVFWRLSSPYVPSPQYTATGQVGDSAGYGTLSISVSNQPTNTTCATIDEARKMWETAHPNMKPAYAPTGCTDHTLQDGTVAAVTTFAAATGTGMSMAIVNALKPDGTTLQLVSSSNAMVTLTSLSDKPTIRQDPPLSGDDLLRLAQLTALKY